MLGNMTTKILGAIKGSRDEAKSPDTPPVPSTPSDHMVHDAFKGEPLQLIQALVQLSKDPSLAGAPGPKAAAKGKAKARAPKRKATEVVEPKPELAALLTMVSKAMAEGAGPTVEAEASVDEATEASSAADGSDADSTSSVDTDALAKTLKGLISSGALSGAMAKVGTKRVKKK